jgi:hypothetical protein
MSAAFELQEAQRRASVALRCSPTQIESARRRADVECLPSRRVEPVREEACRPRPDEDEPPKGRDWARIPPDRVASIHAAQAEGETLVQIAERFGMSRHAIGRVLQRRKTAEAPHGCT